MLTPLKLTDTEDILGSRLFERPHWQLRMGLSRNLRLQISAIGETQVRTCIYEPSHDQIWGLIAHEIRRHIRLPD